MERKFVTPIVCAVAALGMVGFAPRTAGAQPANPPSQTQDKPPPAPESPEFDRLFREGARAYNRADFAGAEKAWLDALEKAPALHDERRTANLLNNLAIVYNDMGRFETSLEYHRRALEIREKRGDPLDIALSLDNIGFVYGRQGQFAKSLDFHNRALTQFEKMGRLPDVAYCLNGIGIAYAGHGQYDKALDYLLRALTIREKINDAEGMAHSLGNLGNIYHRLGQFDKARDYYARALAQFQAMGRLPDIATTLSNLGSNYGNAGQYAQAIDYFERALPLQEKLGNPQSLGFTLTNLGNACKSLEQYDKAAQYLTRALTLFEKSGNPQSIATALSDLGTVYGQQGRRDKELDCYNRALALAEKSGNRHDTALFRSNLGMAYALLGRYDEAEAALSRAIAEFEQVGQQIGDPAQAGAFQQINQGSLYAYYATLLQRRKQSDAALAIIERRRGQGLAKQAAQNRADLSRRFSSQDAAELQQRTEELTQAEETLRSLQRLYIPRDAEGQARFAQDLAKARSRTETAERQHALFQERLYLKYPDYRRLQGAKPPTAQELRALSRKNPDTLYLEYALIDAKNTLLCVLHNGNLRLYTLPVGQDVLTKQVEVWRDAIFSRRATEPKLARSLYDALLAPALEGEGVKGRRGERVKGKTQLPNNPTPQLPNTQHLVTLSPRHPFTPSRLVIVADGPLLNLPFAALRDRQGKRLVERFALSYAVSLGTLTWPDETARPAAILLCAADPTGKSNEVFQIASRGGFTALPYAQREGKAILGLFAGKETLGLFGKDAESRRVKQEMSKYALLHFATHGVLETQDGLRSGLVLAGNNEEEPYAVLEAREIAGMRLAAKLTVLSACQTGQGQKIGGEGLLGLAWAFRAAGCPSIVASQWSVDDAATETLMVAFYKALKARRRKDEALRKAMLAVKREKAAPYYWAAFQIIGETGPLPDELIR